MHLYLDPQLWQWQSRPQWWQCTMCPDPRPLSLSPCYWGRKIPWVIHSQTLGRTGQLQQQTVRSCLSILSCPFAREKKVEGRLILQMISRVSSIFMAKSFIKYICLGGISVQVTSLSAKNTYRSGDIRGIIQSYFPVWSLHLLCDWSPYFI